MVEPGWAVNLVPGSLIPEHAIVVMCELNVDNAYLNVFRRRTSWIVLFGPYFCETFICLLDGQACCKDFEPACCFCFILHAPSGLA